MIRVNLMRNRVENAGTGIQEIPSESGGARDAIVKVLLIFLGIVILKFYEGRRLEGLNGEVVLLTAKVAELDNQLAEKQKEVEGIKDIATQAQELEAKLKVLKLLSRLRLREVKTLDFMQSSIPEKVWLKGLVYESNKNALERGQFQFKGMAVTTDDITDFQKRLEDSTYLSEVITIKNQELAGQGRAGSLRDFLFTAEVEYRN